MILHLFDEPGYRERIFRVFSQDTRLEFFPLVKRSCIFESSGTTKTCVLERGTSCSEVFACIPIAYVRRIVHDALWFSTQHVKERKVTFVFSLKCSHFSRTASVLAKLGLVIW